MKEQKEQVLEYAKKIYERGHVVGAAGNVSVRVEGADQLVITPTRIPYERMTIDDIVVIDHDLDIIEGNWAPSFESRLHIAVYQDREDVGAVIHTHSPHCVAHAVLGKRIEPISEELVPYVGGPVECAEFGMSGSDDLIENARKALGPRAACLMHSHGLLACGKNLEKAFNVAELCEYAARIAILASSIGEPRSLPADVVEMEAGVYEYVKDM